MNESQSIVTIKIGVSRTAVAFHQGMRIARLRHHPTPAPNDQSVLRNFFRGLWPDLPLENINASLVCVVPALRPSVLESWHDRTGRYPIDFSFEKAPFSVAYRPSGTLGADRAACVWGALSRFGDTVGRSFVVADVGTHTVTTFCVNGEVLGGGILPGLFLMQKSLGDGRVDLLRGKNVLGKEFLHRGSVIGMTTEEGIFAGVVEGSIDAILGLRKRAEEKFGRVFPMVLTGGLSWFVAPLIPSKVLVNRQLVHYGAWSFLAGR